MCSSLARALAASLAFGCVSLVAATASAGDQRTRPVPAAKVIVIPGPELTKGTIDPVGMDWLTRLTTTRATARR